jgi:hypothetical protein
VLNNSNYNAKLLVLSLICGRELGVPPFIFDAIAVMVECLIWART